MADLWVFGYGSLMWRPGFTHICARPATLTGYRRCFCVYSVYHRGSPSRPGLVLGLDQGGVCHGLAFRVASDEAAAALRYLRAREQVTGVYRETTVPVMLDRHEQVPAIAYIAERAHPNYTGRIAISDQARLIRAGSGLSGTNLDYLVNTLRHLTALGIRERELERILVTAGPVFGQGRDAVRSPRIDALVGAVQHTPVGPAPKPRGDLRRFLHRQLVKPQLSILKG